MVITSFKSVIILVVVFTLVLKVSLERHLPRVKRSVCPSENWSQWINNDKPSTGDGEYETMDPMTRSSFCHLGRITSAVCVEVSYKPLDGVKYTCTSTNGLVCLNADNGPTGCPDMMIHYKCKIPCPPAPLLIATTTQTSPTMSTPTTFLTSVTQMTTSTSAASSPLTSLLLSTSTTMVDSRTTALKTFSLAQTVSTTGFAVHSTSTITVSNSTTSVESSTAVRTTQAMNPSHLPTSTVKLFTATSSTSTPSSSVLVSTRKVPLSVSTVRYADIFISLTSTSFKSTLEMSQSDAGPVKAVENVQKDAKALQIWPIHMAMCGVLFLVTLLLVIKICIMSRKERKSEADTENPARMRPRKGSIQVHPHLNF